MSFQKLPGKLKIAGSNTLKFFDNRPNLSRYLGIAFTTEANRKKYFHTVAEQWKGDDERIDIIFERTIIGRNLRIAFWRYFLCICAIAFAVANYNDKHPYLGIFYGISFFIFTQLSFLNTLENDNKKLTIEIYDLIGRKKKTRETQKPVTITVKDETFHFYLQDILTIEYFLWLAKEQTESIKFQKINFEVIEKKIFEKWSIRKNATLEKLLSYSEKSNFSFLSYNIDKTNRKRKSVIDRLDAISNYFAVNDFWEAKKRFDGFFDLEK